MTQPEYSHQFHVGQAVLARLDGAPIPGVVEDTDESRVLVRLSRPWIDETGRSSDEVWLTPDKLDPSIEEETGGTEALPG